MLLQFVLQNTSFSNKTSGRDELVAKKNKISCNRLQQSATVTVR